MKVEFSQGLIRRIYLTRTHVDGGPYLPDTLRKLRDEMGMYLEGSLREFSSYPLDLSGLEPFTLRVLEVVKGIPFGSVVSYGDVARLLGGVRFSRAVGLSLSKNPFPVLIPCHRVVGSRGSLGGFSQGLEIKRLLLSIEGVL